MFDQKIETVQPKAMGSCSKALSECLSMGEQFALETKKDGQRVFVYYSNGQFQYKTRFCKDTNPKLLHGLDSALLQSIRGTPEITSFIIDCELMQFDTRTSAFLPLTEMLSDKKKSPEIFGCFIAFDVLLFNDKSMTDEPLRVRRELLEKHFSIVANRFELSKLKWMEGKCLVKLEAAFNEVIEAKEEGIVLKPAEGVYSKTGSGWLKLKPMKMGLSETVDVLLIGGKYGKTKDRKCFGSFLTAVLDTTSRHLKTVCFVSNGLTMDNKRMLSKRIQSTSGECPKWLDLGKAKADFYVTNPKKAMAVAVRLEAFVPSQKYTATDNDAVTVSIRTPVVVAVRYLKSEDCSLNKFRTVVQATRDSRKTLKSASASKKGRTPKAATGSRTRIKTTAKATNSSSPKKRRKREADTSSSASAGKKKRSSSSKKRRAPDSDTVADTRLDISDSSSAVPRKRQKTAVKAKSHKPQRRDPNYETWTNAEKTHYWDELRRNNTQELTQEETSRVLAVFEGKGVMSIEDAKDLFPEMDDRRFATTVDSIFWAELGIEVSHTDNGYIVASLK